MSDSKKSTPKQGSSTLKRVFIAVAVGAAIGASPFIAFEAERMVVASDLAESKRAEYGENSVLPSSVVDCIIERSVPLQASGIVNDRWSQRTSGIESLSEHFAEKAVDDLTLGTIHGAECFLGSLVDVLESPQLK